MAGDGTTVLLVCHLLLLACLSYSLPLCTNSRAPFTLQSPLAFCPYSGRACCNTTEDSELRRQFQSMNVSDPSCASVLRSILCARCDSFSAELFTVKSKTRSVPVLCNSTSSNGSTKSKSAENDFCATVWDACQNVSVTNSPFAPSLQGSTGVPVNSTTSKLTDLWQSKTVFCDSFGGPSVDGSVCFDGGAVTLNTTKPPPPPNGLCLEKIGNGSYLSMAPHPDGSDRVFLGNQEGKIWLATVPEEGSSGTLGFDEYDPFVDLTDQVHFDTTFGMMGMAFHPNFTRNGRFFASFNCDKVQSPQCSGRCSCNSDVNCDPSKLPPDNGAQPCRYHTVISEFTANGTGPEKTNASPSEVRRIFTMGLPFTGHHGGQILFGPEDGYLYFMMGDGGGIGDPYNFSQNKKSLLGKIMRLDIDVIPSAKEIIDLGLWGNYSIPRDNPSSEDKELQPEIWTLGMRNPWRCSFDSERPSYFLCADVGQEKYEEVDVITKGGNYGWNAYEGYSPYISADSPDVNNSTIPANTIFPIMGYSHSDVNKIEGSASITGGYFYRSTADPCMYGRYLYADLYARFLWAAEETPENSGNFTSTLIPFSCAHDSAIQCTTVGASPLPALGYIYSFGEDNKKDTMLLTSTGVYRVTRPSRCNYTCALENVSASPGPGSSPPPSSGVKVSENLLLFFFSFCVVLLGFM